MGERIRETNNMQLLQDTFIIEQLQVINEGKSDGPTRIRGVFGRCNEKNNNGRIYPTAVLESQLEKVKPLILERRLCGELDHPQNDTVKLSNASHLVTKLEMKGDDLIGEAEILKTPAGLTAKALIEGGVKIGISSRGMGTLSEDHNGDKIVNEDFRLITFDLVADPSTRGAFPGLSESTESKFVRESQSKLTKESNFVTMLNSKLRTAYDPWIEEAKTRKKLTKKQREKMDVEPDGGDGDIDAKDLTRLRAGHDKFEEAMELVRADGHWYMIAEAILETYSEITKKEKTDSTNQKTLKQVQKLRRDILRGQYGGLGIPIPGTRGKHKNKEAKQNRKPQDQQQIAAGTTYKQIGNILMEAYEDNQKEDDAENAAKAAAKALKAPKSRRREGPLARSLRHGSEIRQQRKVRDTNREADKFDSANKRHQTSQDVAAGVKDARTKALGGVVTQAETDRESARQSTKTADVQDTEERQQAHKAKARAAAKPGSIGSVGVMQGVKNLAGDAASKATDMAVKGSEKIVGGAATTIHKAGGMAGRGLGTLLRKRRAAARAAENKPYVPASEMGDGAPGPGVAGGKTKEQHRAERNRKTSTAQTNAATADIKRRAGNKAATDASFGAGIGATSKEDESERQAIRKSIARQEKKTGKKIALTGKQASKIEHKAYKQIGSMLAEAFGLVEKLLHTMGDKEKQEMRRKFRLDQQGKAPQNRVRAGKSAAQNATLDKELDTQIVQSGGDRKIKV